MTDSLNIQVFKTLFYEFSVSPFEYSAKHPVNNYRYNIVDHIPSSRSSPKVRNCHVLDYSRQMNLTETSLPKML